MLTELGHQVIDLAMRLPQAAELASTADLAILDVNLDGRGPSGLDPAYQGHPVFTKPFLVEEPDAAIAGLA